VARTSEQTLEGRPGAPGASSASGTSRWVVLGRVTGAHGIRGRVRVRWLGDGPDNLLQAAEVWLREPRARHAADADADADADAERGAPPRRYAVRDAGLGGGGAAWLELEGLDDRDAALALRGSTVEVPPERLEALPEGEVYWHQVVGCRVLSHEGGEIGVVRELWETGAHDVLVVEAADGRRHLLPAAGALLREVDVEGRTLVIEILPGMLD